jgi:hypothetical protein
MRLFPTIPLIAAVCLSAAPTLAPRSLTKCEIGFVSEAPLERITAATKEASGLFDAVERSFAVRIPVIGFQGFNSPLQREHFLENYMEVDRFPHAVFKGRLIEAVDLTVPGTHHVRAKGTFSVHGVDQERIIECTIVSASNGLRVTGTFDVALADHGIRIPKIVQQKLAPVVQVKVDLLFAGQGS